LPSFGESVLSLSQRAYLIAEGLRESSRAVFIVYVVLIGFISLIVLESYFSNAHPKDLRPIISFIIVVYSIAMIWYFIRARYVYHELNQWQEAYLDQAYIINFDTAIPEGNTTGEKVFRLARTVFPELTPYYADFSPYYSDHIKSFFRRKIRKAEVHDISKSLNYTVGSYTFDLALKTTKGYFIVKDFKGKVATLDDLKQLVDVICKKFKDKYQRTFVFRVICVAEEYDKLFLEQESLEKQMTEKLDAGFRIDLLVEEKAGYSVLWIDKK
jgi:hypothetical protein